MGGIIPVRDGFAADVGAWETAGGQIQLHLVESVNEWRIDGACVGDVHRLAVPERSSRTLTVPAKWRQSGLCRALREMT